MCVDHMSIGPAPVDPHLCLLPTVEALFIGDWLIGQWNTESLGLSSQVAFPFCCKFLGFNARSVLHLLLTYLIFAPGCEDDVPGVEVCHEFLPVFSPLSLIIKALQRPFVHVLLDLLQDNRQFFLKLNPLHLQFLPVIAQNNTCFLVLNILRAKFQSNGHTL